MYSTLEPSSMFDTKGLKYTNYENEFNLDHRHIINETSDEIMSTEEY